VLPGQGLLDRRLSFEQPIQGVVEFVLVDSLQTQRLAEAGGGGRRIEPARGRELRGRRDQPADDHGDDEVAAALVGRPEDAVQADRPQGSQRRGDVPVRQRAEDRHRLPLGGDDLAALEQGAKALDELLRPIGEVGQGPLLDLAVLAIGFPQQDGGRRVAVGDGLDILSTYMATIMRAIRAKARQLSSFTWVQNNAEKSSSRRPFKGLRHRR
jgi:hypothetical protein